jgi:hypothetical protein
VAKSNSRLLTSAQEFFFLLFFCVCMHIYIVVIWTTFFFPFKISLQLSHGSSHGHSGVTNRGGISVVGNPGFSSSTNGVGGSIPGILPTSAAIGNRNAVPGLGVSPILGNAGPRITSSMGNMGNIGRSIGSGGGLSVPGLASRLNLNANSGSGSLNVQGQNRLMGNVLAQGISFNWIIYLYRSGLRER